MKRRILVSFASVALCLGAVAVVQAGAATKTLRASGGSLTFRVAVRNAKLCSWSSSPTIAGFSKTVQCKSGAVARSADFKVNTSTTAKSYVVTLTVRGQSTMVDRWKVIQAGQTLPPITTFPSPTATGPTPCVVGTCSLTFSGPDPFGAMGAAVESVTQNVANPDPSFNPTPAGDQLDEMTVGMESGPTGMSNPGVEVFSFALALVGGTQGSVDLSTFDSRIPNVLGLFGPVAPNSPLTAFIYYDVPTGVNWTSVNFRLGSNVYVFLPS
jgi:hypothetical protein